MNLHIRSSTIGIPTGIHPLEHLALVALGRDSTVTSTDITIVSATEGLKT